MTNTNEFLVWENECPVVAMATEQEFAAWQDDAPVADIDEGFSNIIPSTVRRQVYIF